MRAEIVKDGDEYFVYVDGVRISIQHTAYKASQKLMKYLKSQPEGK